MWRFTAFGVICFVILQLSLSFSPQTTKHACAPAVPPPVSGTLVQPPAISGILFINEVLLTPHSTWNCSEFNTYSTTEDSWIEIYNAQDKPFDLYSVHTAIDSGQNTNSYYLPFGAAIAPHGFLVVFPCSSGNFSSTETGTLRLLIGNTIVDGVKVPPLGEDQSYARTPDGGSSWVTTSVPTIDSSDIASAVLPTVTRTRAEATATVRAERGFGGTADGGSGGKSGNGSSSGDNRNTDGSANKKQIDGIQPVWQTLHHPDTVSTAPSPAIQSAATLFTPVTSGDLDVPHKIILTLLVVALAFALLWCWKLFYGT